MPAPEPPSHRPEADGAVILGTIMPARVERVVSHHVSAPADHPLAPALRRSTVECLS
jgi:hypothetical protein